MISTKTAALEQIRALHTTIRKLALVSHAPIQGYNFAPNEIGRGDRWRKTNTHDPLPHLGAHPGRHVGTAIPRGDIDHKGDRTVEYRQKSAEHFARRLQRMVDDKRRTYTAEQLKDLHDEALAALEAWRKTPLIAGERPALRDPRWKYWVANCEHSTADILRWYGISRQYLHQIRRKYREDQDAA